METKERPWTLPIASLRPGMAIDLEALEEWLDLDDCPSCEVIRMTIRSEFAVIEGVEREACNYMRLDTTQGSFWLPGDIVTLVMYEDER